MKIQNNKTKKYIKIGIFGVAILLIMMTVPTISNTIQNHQMQVYAQTTGNTNDDTNEKPIKDKCIVDSEKTVHFKESQFDFNTTKMVVTNSSMFQSMVNGYNYTYDSVNDDWTIGKKDCSLTWNSVNVIYSLYDSNGIVKNIEFSIDPQTTQIIKVREYVPAKSNIANISSPNWGGYEFAGTNQISTSSPKIYKAFASYTQPQVTTPTDSMWGVNACSISSYPKCDVDTWVGLEGGQGGKSGTTPVLVQSGTQGVIQCHGCSALYYAWYEFVSTTSSEQQCTGTINPLSDTIQVTVQNDAIIGGNSGKYDITSTDTSTGSLCSVPATSYSMTPVGTPYIVERVYNPSSCSQNTGNYCTLGVPKTGFTNTVTYSGTITYSNGTSQSIYTPWNRGYYVSDTMQNPPNTGTQNLSNGQVLSSGQFTVSYLSSGGT